MDKTDIEADEHMPDLEESDSEEDSLEWDSDPDEGYDLAKGYIERKNEIKRVKHMLRKCANVKSLYTCDKVVWDDEVHTILGSMKEENEDSFNVIKYVDIELPHGKTSCLVDCGCSISIVSEDLIKKHYPDFKLKKD